MKRMMLSSRSFRPTRCDHRPSADSSRGRSAWPFRRSTATRHTLGVMAACAFIPVAAFVSAVPAAAAPTARIMGVITAAPGTSLPTSFQMRRANGMMATVNVPATAAIALRYGGAGTIATLTPGDHLVLNGAFQPGAATFDATRIQDLSIERVNASTRVVVSRVDAATNSVVANVTGVNYGSPLRGAVTVDIASGTSIAFPNGQAVSASSLQTGDVLSLNGLYDMQSHTLLSVTSLRGLRLISSVTTSLQPIAVTMHGFVYRRQHYVTVSVHTIANALVRVVLHFSGQQRVFSGRTGIHGYYVSRRLIAYGYWPRARLVQAVVVVQTGGQHVRTTTRAYVA